MSKRRTKYQFKKKKTVLAGLEIPVVLLPILAIVFIASVFFAIEAASMGATLAYLEQQKTDLLKENAELSSQLVSLSSLRKAGEKAKDLGFGKPSNVVYITEEEVVAMLP